jgi:hypothetical protein
VQRDPGFPESLRYGGGHYKESGILVGNMRKKEAEKDGKMKMMSC